jgi:hypothetical protein
MARKLQEKNPEKRAKTREKAKESRAQRKRAIELEEEPVDEQSGGELEA